MLGLSPLPLLRSPDYPELYAQVPAPVPHREGQRHPEAPLLYVPDLRVPGDRLRGGDRVSERQGEPHVPVTRTSYFVVFAAKSEIRVTGDAT